MSISDCLLNGCVVIPYSFGMLHVSLRHHLLNLTLFACVPETPHAQFDTMVVTKTVRAQAIHCYHV
jgi:hypothetical protein